VGTSGEKQRGDEVSQSVQSHECHRDCFGGSRGVL
jgi:hypothetical protein